METWKFINGCSHYQISDLGRVRSLGRDVQRSDGKKYSIKTRILKQQKNHAGYFMVWVKPDNGPATLRVLHQLVAEHFIGPRPDGAFICHNDGVKTNNHPSNLRYDTPKSNSADYAKHVREPYENVIRDSALLLEDGFAEEALGILKQFITKIDNPEVSSPPVTRAERLLKELGL